MKLLRVLFRLSLLAVLLLPIFMGLAVFLALDRRPAIARAAEFTPAHVERAKRILDSNDPRRLRTGSVRTVAVSAADADLALNYLAQRYGDGGAEARFSPDRLEVRASVQASVLPMRPFVNAAVQLAEGSPLPVVERVRVGWLPMPVWLAEVMFQRLTAVVWTPDDLAALKGAIKDVQFATTGARLTYEWRGSVADAVRNAMIDPAGRERLRVYQEVLAEATRRLPPGSVSLTELLRPLFATASTRSETSDPINENRAAIVVLTFYVDGRSPADVMPEARSWPRAERRAVTLNGRTDFPKHFMISAALSSNTGGPFADAVGVYKEVADSQGGTGFSFDDIAADRAGSRLGTLAEGRESARRLQMELAQPLTERAIMPHTSGLPTGLPEAEFKQRFGDADAPAYKKVVDDIDRRIAAMTLYR